MCEYNIQKIEPDLKSFLDILVRKELTGELNLNNIDIVAREINNDINQFIKNDDGTINKDKNDVIRELFAQTSKINNYYDSKYNYENK
jgi:hypothetical protein